MWLRAREWWRARVESERETKSARTFNIHKSVRNSVLFTHSNLFTVAFLFFSQRFSPAFLPNSPVFHFAISNFN